MKWLASLVLGLVACGAPSPQPLGLTWHKDARAIVESRCSNECHHRGGIGLVAFDADSAPAWSKLMVQRIDAGQMPPWPPGPLSVPLEDSRAMAPAEIELLRRWSMQPSVGDPEDYVAPPARPPRFNPGSPPDLTSLMPMPYQGPQVATDELRCFLLPIEPGTLRAYRMHFGSPLSAYHHAGAQIISVSTAAKVRATLDGKDGRPGWDCAGGVPEYLANLTHTWVGPDTGYVYPEGLGAVVPNEAALVLNLHYQPGHQAQLDQSGLELWYTTASVQPVVLGGFQAPSEVPCPTGISTDPSSPCSRAYAVAHALWPGSAEQSQVIVESCGQSLADYGKLAFGAPEPHWYVTGTCTKSLGVTGKIMVIGAHAHPNTTAVHIEIDQGDGFKPLLDFPRWSWVWESKYSLVTPMQVHATDRIRLTCIYDNGTDAQPSAATHDYGHDAPAIPPLDTPLYQIWDVKKNASMCSVDLDYDVRTQ